MKRNRFTENYAVAPDKTGIVLTGLLLLPNIVSWIMAAAREMYGNPYATGGLNIAALVFLILSLPALCLLVKRERGKFDFFAPFATFAVIFLLLYYIAWVFYFCSYGNIAVRVFLAVCLPLSLLTYEADRRNFPAMVPTVLFAALHIAATAVSLA